MILINCRIDLVKPTAEFKMFGKIYSAANLKEFVRSPSQFLNSKMSEIVTWLKSAYGEFSFAFRSENGDITLGRDSLGVAPLYYSFAGDSHLIATSSLQDIVDLLPSVTLNAEYLKKISANNFSDLTSTPFNEIRKCPPGHLIRVNNSGIEVQRYWGRDDLLAHDLLAHDQSQRQSTLNAAAAEVSDTLNQIILDHVQSGEPHGVLLSGGLDSSLIAKTLSDLSKPNPKNLVTASYNYAGNPELDLDAMQSVVARLHCEHRTFGPSEIDLQSFNRPVTPQPIYYTPTLWLFKPLLEFFVLKSARVVATGLGGDDIFQPGPDIISDLSLIKNFDLILKFLKYERAERNILLTFTKFYLKPRALKAAAKFLKTTNICSLLTLETCQKLTDYADFSAKTRSLLYRFVNWGGYCFGFEQEQEFAQTLNLRFTYPLLDRRLLELAARLPTQHFVPGPLSKVLLREVAKTKLPPVVTQRISTQNYTDFTSDVIHRQKSSLLTEESNKDFKNSRFVDDLLARWYYDHCRSIAEKKLTERQNLKGMHYEQNTEKSALPEALN